MAKMVDPLGHHDWESSDYVSGWAKRQEDREAGRQKAFRALAETIPYDKNDAIKLLDLGAGYGGLTQFLLRHFPNATAVCQDGSAEMAKLGHERMKVFAGRFRYVVCDFSKPGWSRKLTDQFEAVVSSIAIHNVREGKIIGEIYREAFPLVKPGGCFLNFDRQRPPLEEQLEALKAAGFSDVNYFWKDEKRAVFGGFRPGR
jgi:ubiquinone/menaquinone biosynthesis C-methylase UbiE